MSDNSIAVEALGKSYLVGHESANRERYVALRDVITSHVRNLSRKTWDMFRGRQIVQGDEIEEFWALDDVTFEVRPGEVLGIVGGNGAGKSTLLKILSRITEPTRGRVRIRGRVASLLEVGTGFHPELSGRENIFLNAAILGMSRKETREKFDEIVAFAEVERFIDTPVKRYSSGMYVRLAFAVAAHLDPEILVIDEVLAVGDLKFQRKCLGKMGEIASGQGRTVLFVSHNREAVINLCTRAIALQKGKLIFEGKPLKAIEKLSENYGVEKFSEHLAVEDRTLRRGDGRARYTSFRVETVSENNVDTVKIHLECRVNQDVPRLESSVLLKTPLGSESICTLSQVLSETEVIKGSRFRISFDIPVHIFGIVDLPIYVWLGSDQRNPFDVIDGLLPPLAIKPSRTVDGMLNGRFSDDLIHLPYNVHFSEF